MLGRTIAKTVPSPSPPGSVSVQPSTNRVKMESVAPLAARSASRRPVTFRSACRCRARRRSSSSSIPSASSAEIASTHARGKAPCFRRVPANNTPRRRPRDPTGAHTALCNSNNAPSMSGSAVPSKFCSTVRPPASGSSDGNASSDRRVHSDGVPSPPRSKTTPRKTARPRGERESISPSSIQTPARSTSLADSSAWTALRTRSDLSVPGDCARRATFPEPSECPFCLPLNRIRYQPADELMHRRVHIRR